MDPVLLFFFSGKGGGPNIWYLIILRDIPNAEFNLLSKSSKYTKHFTKDYWCWFREKFDKIKKNPAMYSHEMQFIVVMALSIKIPNRL